MFEEQGPLEPTYENCFVQGPQDALLLVQAVIDGMLECVERRPQDQERKRLIQSGNIFIFNETRGHIQRWTDGVSWSPSRILGDFLIYREKRTSVRYSHGASPSRKSIGDHQRSQSMNGITKKPVSALHHQHQVSSPQHPTYVNMASPQYPTYGGGHSARHQTPEYNLYGSLTSNEQYKEDGLIKKTISIPYKGCAYRLISYYFPEDVEENRLLIPTQDPKFDGITVSAELAEKKSLRYSIPINQQDLMMGLQYSPPAGAGFSYSAPQPQRLPPPPPQQQQPRTQPQPQPQPQQLMFPAAGPVYDSAEMLAYAQAAGMVRAPQYPHPGRRAVSPPGGADEPGDAYPPHYFPARMGGGVFPPDFMGMYSAFGPLPPQMDAADDTVHEEISRAHQRKPVRSPRLTYSNGQWSYVADHQQEPSTETPPALLPRHAQMVAPHGAVHIKKEAELDDTHVGQHMTTAIEDDPLSSSIGQPGRISASVISQDSDHYYESATSPSENHLNEILSKDFGSGQQQHGRIPDESKHLYMSATATTAPYGVHPI